jgi:hypothetical protein
MPILLKEKGAAMKVKFPLLVQDQLTAQMKGMPPVENLTKHHEDFFLDGPVTKRVAVLNFDPETGALSPGVSFRRPANGSGVAGYEIKDETDLNSLDFNQVSVFATILNTMYMFEEPDTLGRPLTWAFNGPQLLVIPRAGEWANAFYERETHSLQFFHFQPEANPENTVYTSLSHDIVCHETGHAILDGIAPDLYNCISPQALALHEAVADLTALTLALRSDPLREAVLYQTGGDLKASTAFSRVAEEFGRASDSRSDALRSLFNERTLDPKDESKDEFGRPNRVARNEPHDLSEVLSGAFYSVLVKIFEDKKQKTDSKTGKPYATNKALWVAAERFKRMIFRALDYLPPGEVSFADYGRAIIASDQASHPNDKQEREWICEEFIKRHMITGEGALKVETNFEARELADVDLQTLADSDWAAYEFANKNRKLLGIPEGVHFRVRPRLDATKKYIRGPGKQESIRELIFKVSWDYKEPNHLGQFFPAERQITVGTTLAIDWVTKKVRAIVTSDFSERPSGGGRKRKADRQQQKADRDLMLERMLDDGVLQLSDQIGGPDGKPRTALVSAETMGNLMRIRGAARMLHII